MHVICISTGVYLLCYAIARPITRCYFSTWPLGGVPAGMVIGSMLFTWVVWLAAHLALPLNTIAIWITLVMLVGVAYSCERSRPTKAELLGVLWSVVAFASLVIIYIVFRRHNADIVGLEKFPDLAFFTSAFKARQMP